MKRDSKNRMKIKKIALWIAIVLISLSIYGCKLNIKKDEEVKPTNPEERVQEEVKIPVNQEDVINIGLFGIDTRDNDYDGSRADTIMIASLDRTNKKVKLTSIMRDTYVDIPGQGYDKINHSYAFGGPELTIETINHNFDMNITDYVTVNFSAIEKIVDGFGGVDIDVKANEIDTINRSASVKITEPGLQTLNGQQALVYSRIRNEGNGDFERTQRQRSVLENVINKVMANQSLPQIIGLIENISPYIDTSYSKTEIIGLATTVFSTGINGLEQTRIPLDENSNGGLWDGTYYLKPDTLVDNVIYLHDFIYENQGYVPSEIVNGISSEISKFY
jgi:LCP family protein required for cell wall assembly